MEPLFKPISIDESVEGPLDITDDEAADEWDNDDDYVCHCYDDYEQDDVEEDNINWLGGEDGVD